MDSKQSDTDNKSENGFKSGKNNPEKVLKSNKFDYFETIKFQSLI